MGLYLVSLIPFTDSNWQLAQVSVRASCGDFTDEDRQKYTSGGSVERNASGVFVKIIQNNSEVLKHENCHLFQMDKYPVILNTCPMRFTKTLIEYECYIADGLPDDIYMKRYGNYTENLEKYIR